MKAIKIYILLLIITGFFSCKTEELPSPQNGTIVFSVSGDWVDITAGEDDFYLFTDYEKDTSDVYSFIGRFAKTSDCETDCNEELLIKIRDIAQHSGTGGVDIDNALAIGNYSYKVLNTAVSNDEIIVNLVAEPEGNGPFTYNWTVTYIDSTINTSTYNTETVSLSFSNNFNIQSLDVCLMVLNNNACQIQYCNDIFLDPNAIDCQADIEVVSSPALIQLEAVMSNGSAPFSYSWSNGMVTETIAETINGPFNATYCVTITDANNCSDEICKEITLTQGGTTPIICGSRFSYEKIFEPGIGDSLQLNTVFIQYTDPDGNVLMSDLQAQPNSSYFEIISVEDYDDNENGDKTKKMSVSVNCVLLNDQGAGIEFPFEGVIGVAYP